MASLTENIEDPSEILFDFSKLRDDEKNYDIKYKFEEIEINEYVDKKIYETNSIELNTIKKTNSIQLIVINETQLSNYSVVNFFIINDYPDKGTNVDIVGSLVIELQKENYNSDKILFFIPIIKSSIDKPSFLQDNNIKKFNPNAYIKDNLEYIYYRNIPIKTQYIFFKTPTETELIVTKDSWFYNKIQNSKYNFLRPDPDSTFTTSTKTDKVIMQYKIDLNSIYLTENDVYIDCQPVEILNEKKDFFMKKNNEVYIDMNNVLAILVYFLLFILILGIYFLFLNYDKIMKNYFRSATEP